MLYDAFMTLMNDDKILSDYNIDNIGQDGYIYAVFLIRTCVIT